MTSTASAADQKDHRPHDDQHPPYQFLRKHFRPARRCLYDQLAIEYGHVVPDDPVAIEHFYEVTIHTLPCDVSEEILDRLIAADDMFDTGEELPPGFDASGRRYADLPDVPLPMAGPPGELEADMAEVRLQIQRADAADARAARTGSNKDKPADGIEDRNANAHPGTDQQRRNADDLPD